ncbi:hypothetical protein RI129_009094 [Pyrocoelia pectoralis]|uniref:Uncharacterized protein n=1 Tax=Pyrocoelia pectoralis TaxID=417401 RepID=A0AAN7V8I7_9COLE
MLQDTLTTKTAELDELNEKIVKVEGALQISEFKRDDEKQICKQTVSSLTKALNDIQQQMKRRLEECHKERDLKEEELKKYQENVLKEHERRSQQKIRNLEERLEREIDATSKGENRLHSLLEEIVDLQNRLKQIESQHSSNRIASANEINALENINNNLTKEIESIKISYSDIEKVVEKLKYENDILNNELTTNRENINNLIKQNKTIVSENTKLKEENMEKEKLHKALLLNNERLECDKQELELECAELNDVVKENSDRPCKDPSHNNFDFILKQNVVLKELVKQMKKEKEELHLSNTDAENRIKKLEDLMFSLKQKICG